MTLATFLRVARGRHLLWRADLAARRADRLFLAGDRAQDEAFAHLARARVIFAAHLRA